MSADPRPAVALFDFDGTVTRVDSFVALMVAVGRRRLGRHRFGRLTRMALDYGRRRIDNHGLKERFVADLEGVERVELLDLTRALFEGFVRRTIRPSMRERIAEHRREGTPVVLVSASLDEQLAPAAEHLGVDRVLGTRCEVKGDRLTGRLVGRTCHGAEKVRRVEELCVDRDLDLSRAIAYGDHPSDLLLLERCGRAVVVGRRLAGLARSRGWEVQT